MYNTLERRNQITVDWDTMPKKKESGRIRGKNVDILDDAVYDALVERAESQKPTPVSLRVYVNKVLRDKILTDKALTHYYPNLRKSGYDNGIIMIRDDIMDKVAQVRLKKKQIHCDLCDSATCVHICYATSLPEFGYLFEKLI